MSPVRRPLLLALAALLLALAGCASAPAAPQPATEIVVFAAASLTDAFGEIGRGFERANPGTAVSFNFAGSQQLAAQLGQGAPADVFASASGSQMRAAIDSGRVIEDGAQIFARNQLVVITSPGSKERIAELQDLAQPGVKLVFAAQAVPIGQYSLDFLDKAGQDPAFGASYKSGVLANVVSYEDNVRAVLTKVGLGEGDAGIVYGSDVVASPEAGVGQLAIPAELNVIAGYPIAPLSDSAHAELAQAFVRYTLSDEAQRILERYGFSRP